MTTRILEANDVRQYFGGVRAVDGVTLHVETGEVLGIVALEALAGGAPLIVADTGGLAELVGGTGSALTFEPGNAHELADCIERVLTDRELADDLVRAGKVRAIGCSNFDAAQLQTALDVAARNNLPRYDVVQPEYNLHTRDKFEGPLADLCIREEIGVIIKFQREEIFESMHRI